MIRMKAGPDVSVEAFASSTTALAGSPPSEAVPTKAGATTRGIEDVVVTARRTEERAQEVVDDFGVERRGAKRT